ncbi:hypothetical protein SSX86_032760 [Deinandra increscens subsp. villosa]|uniref:Mitochondrial inner membrane protease ATP23 n=1 Tax=Deinandra increscens subsp. villosa TaxID=3103831 RepID=A0AAP0C784_9ASTR
MNKTLDTTVTRDRFKVIYIHKYKEDLPTRHPIKPLENGANPTSIYVRTNNPSPFTGTNKKMSSDPDSGDSFSSATKGGMTVEECENMIQGSLRIPTVKFLREHLEKSGCSIAPNFIKAVNCNQRMSGGYVRGEGIVVCSNHLTIQDEVNQVVIHELIHAYDDCRAANLDWTNCAHHACSEIRAGHLSGDCHYKRELLRGFVKIRGHEQVSYVKDKILDDDWWDKVSYILSFTGPIYDMIRVCDTDKPCLHLVYEMWDSMIEKVKDEIYKKERHLLSARSIFYDVVHEVLVARWAKNNTPLYCLAHSLNPRYYCDAWLSVDPARVGPHY